MRTRTSFKPGNTVGFKKGYDPNRNTTIPGPGAPKQRIRWKMQEKLEEKFEELDQLLKDGKVRHEWYFEFLARYGHGTKVENETTFRDVTFTPEERAARVIDLVERAKQRAKKGA